MNTDKFFAEMDRLYDSWRDYSIRVENAKAGQPQSFYLKDLQRTSFSLYTRLIERFDSAKDLGIELPDNRPWSWMRQGY